MIVLKHHRIILLAEAGHKWVGKRRISNSPPPDTENSSSLTSTTNLQPTNPVVMLSGFGTTLSCNSSAALCPPRLG
ncbi:UV radiation resistance associated protein [Fusarium oxysporum f. sp. albedinis]|nr:UV radiation resistance associated protein [Fusarium oxysporum f. sp. albedinis]